MRRNGTFTRPGRIISRGVAAALAVLFVLALGVPEMLHAQDRSEIQTGNVDEIPYSVAIEGDYAVVGAEWHDGYRGAAYVLRRDGDGWIEQQKLQPADLGRYDHFGGSASISGGCIVVGSTWHDLFRGAAYVFRLSDGVWVEQQKLSASDAVPDDRFGAAVNIDGDVITVTAVPGSSRSAGSGASYRFELIGGRWQEQGKSTFPQPGASATRADELAAGIGTADEALELADGISSEYGDPPIRYSSAAMDTIGWVTATDGTLEDRVEITWEDVGRDDIIYKVLRDGILLSVVSSDDAYYSDETGTLGVTYTYCVVIKYMTEPESAPVCDDGSRVIFAPSAVTASDGQYTDRVGITWIDLSTINEGYHIYRDDSLISTVGPNGTSYSDTGAWPDSVHAYEVAAFVSGGYESARIGDSGWRGLILPPLSVAASEGQYADRVVITWQDQATDEEGYRIYRNSLPIDSTGVDAESYVDSTVVFGVTYTYCVATKGSGGIESIWICDEGHTGLTAPGNVSASDSTFDDRIRITWDDLSNVEDGYEITRAEIMLRDTLGPYAKPGPKPKLADGLESGHTYLGESVVVGTTGADASFYDDFTAAAGVAYQYSVRAISDEGGYSASVSDEGYRVFVLAPFNVQATDGEYEDRTYITWESSSATAAIFLIFRDGTFIKSVDESQKYFSDYGGIAGQQYDYGVVAVTAVDSVSSSTHDTGRRELLSPAPVKAGDDEYEDRVIISWTDNSAVENGYRVYRRESADTASVLIATTKPNRTSFVDYYGKSAVSYVYSVAAYDTTDGGSAGESAVGTDEGSRLLIAPTGVYATDGTYEDRIEITWNDNSNAEDGYYIYRDTALIDSTADNYTSYVDYGAMLGEVREYSIAAFDAIGPSAASSDFGSVDILAPVSVNASDFYPQGIEVTWIDQSEIEEGYKIYRDGELIKAVKESQGYSFLDTLAVFGIKGSYDTPGSAWGVAISGGYAYVADYTSGLQVIDISDPTAPSYAGSYDTPGTAYGVAVSGDYAYVAETYSGLQVIDISDPTAPSYAGGCYTPVNARGVAVSGDYAYVADYDSGLQVIDISDPTTPSYAGSYDTPGYAMGVAISGDYAYVADYGSGLQVIDISDPANPDSVGSYDTPGTAYGVAISGGYTYVADYFMGLQVIDISDPTAPSYAGSYDTPGYAMGVAISGDYAYVADYGSGLQVIDISDPANPDSVGSYDTPGSAYGVAISGDYAYVADENSGLQVIKVNSIAVGETYDYCVRAYSDDIVSDADCDEGTIPEVGGTEITELFLKLLASDGAAFDNFGCRVAISGDRAIVGAAWDDDNGSVSGSAYIYERDAGGTWTETQKLTAGDGAADDYFGSGVAISGDRAIVGAEGDDDNGLGSGSAYIYERDAGDTLIQTQKLTAGDGATGDEFGYDVAISGDRAIVGAAWDDDKGSGSGSAYIYERDEGDTLIQTQKLTAGDGAADDFFGCSVAISGDRAIVGAIGDDDNGSGSGSAYIYERDAGGTWTETQKLTAGDGAEDDRFGVRVAISGDRAIVGAAWDDDNGSVSGSAYIYERDAGGSWTETQKLTAGDGAAGDEFGGDVAISGDRAIVGAHQDDDNGDNSGSAYILDMTGSGEVAATDGTQDSRIRVTWNDSYSGETGFLIYRDGVLYDENVVPDTEFYNDTEASRGRAYEYCVNVILAGDTLNLGCDFGWRPPNGAIAGRVTTRSGAGVEDISVSIDPSLTCALFFDGIAGTVRIRDSEAFDFGESSEFTVEAWIRYKGSGGAASTDESIISKASGAAHFPFELRTDGGNGYPGRLVFTMSDGTQIVSVESDSTGLNDDRWHHVACVHDANLKELSLYIDREFNGSASSAGLGDITNEDDLFIGAGRSGPYHGQIDEVRIWNVARTDVQIRNASNRPLEGDEAGLVGYWPFDEGYGSAVTDFAGEAQYGVMENGVYWADDAAPLDVSAKTDVEGNYVLGGLRFEDGDTLYVRPSEGRRQFQPAFKSVVLSTQSPTVNEINFVEITSYTISGQILFAGTNCPVADAQIIVDGNAMGVTDKNGKYAVSADNGEHTLSAQLGDNTFDPAEISVIVEGDTVVNFTGTTVRVLSGSVGGGCGRYVGDVTINIDSQNGCLHETVAADSASASYSISLPPQVYLVSATVNESTIPSGLSAQDVITFFQNLGVREVDLTTVSDTLDFVYRADLIVAIKGLEPYITCGQLTLDGQPLPDSLDSLPVIPQLEVVTLTIEVDESYGPGETCPLDTGTVVIYDEIFDREDTPVVLPVSNGTAEYVTVATTPSLIIGRMVEGKNRSYQKAIKATAVVEGKDPVSITEWALVTGHLMPEGTEFVTFTSDPMPLFILRDPPGDNSYAYLEEGYSKRSTIVWDQELWSHVLGANLSMAWGLSEKWFVGIGVGKITTFKYQLTIKDQFRLAWIHYEEGKTEEIVSTTQRYSTSASDLFIGESGDVFVGAGFNFLFAEVDVIDIDGCAVVRSTDIGFQPDTISTEFVFSEHHIENILIPELKDKADYYSALEDPDSAAIFQDQADNWQSWLDWNQDIKYSSESYENRSFSAGADFESTTRIDTVESFTKTMKLRIANEAYLGFTFKFLGASTELSAGYEYTDEKLYHFTDWTETESHAVGYVLRDDDIGDNFTVDLKRDGKYRSPIFDVLGGVSSCPWEAWLDSTGVAKMTPRDGARLLIDPVTATGVPPDELAVFDLTLINESGTDEARWYVLRLLSTSNPDGAVVKANGTFLNNGLPFFLEPYEAHQLTMTVERGPSRYTYDSLKVMLYPPCEYAIWERHGGLQRTAFETFNVHFDAPCSEITLFSPEDGWTFDKADQDVGGAVNLILTDYEIDIGEADEGLTIQYVGLQYRHLGEGDESPGEWSAPVLADSLGAIETLIDWQPPDSLEDGAYELRAFTHCAGGEGYSRAVTGTIDRHAPLVFGTPEPADGVLSFGEDISITFSEAIDCESIDPDSVTLEYLDGPNADSLIAHGTVCDGRTIVIAPTVSAAELEGRRIGARVAGVRDRIGNPMAGAAAWEFEYRKSLFAWSDAELAGEVPYLNPGSIQAGLVNGTGQPVDFAITEMPAWITPAAPAAGSLLPGETQSIDFAIQEDLAIGLYHGEVRAEATDTIGGVSTAVLDINLVVSCQAPAWAVDVNGYEQSMTIVAKLDIGGEYSVNESDMVAAFAGSELRGAANIDSVGVFDDDTGYPYSFLAFLTVHSNRTDGETIRFQIWCADSCKLFNSTLESYPFVANAQIGSPDDPVTLTATEVLGDSVLAIPVGAGWNWISTNIRSADMGAAAVLADLTPSPGDIIKSHEAFSQFVDPETGWTPVLVLDNVSGYMLNLADAGTILHTGALVPVDSLIPVSQDWNWIGYLPDGPIAVNDALADLDARGLVSDGDMIKGQDAFAQYLGGSWYGSLASMEPGRGYKLYLGTLPGDTCFAYPPYVGAAPPPPAVVAEPASEAAATEDAPAWSVDPHDYQYNMTVTAVLRVDGHESIDGNDMIGAFVGDRCRGVARPIYIDGVRRYEVFLMIHGNEISGETVAFKAFDAGASVVRDIEETIAYAADAARGTVHDPFIMSASSEDETPDLPKAYALYQNVPNPFNPTTTIGFDLPRAVHVKLCVYNVKGELIATLVDHRMTAGRKEAIWAGTNDSGSGVASGIYFYRLVAGDFVQTRKMVLLR